MNKENLTAYILPILLIILLLASIYYFTSQKNIVKSDETVIQNNSGDSPIVISDYSATGNSQQITSGEVYLQKITEIRTPINKGFEDLNQKLKYKTLFTDDETKQSISNLKNKISSAIDEIKKLNISQNFQDVNNQELKSLDLLSEAITAFENMYLSTDNDERQKQYDLYGYKIDQSNAILQEISIPKY